MFEYLIAEIARARVDERICGIPTPVFARRRKRTAREPVSPETARRAPAPSASRDAARV
jgi:hypothetical protein